MHRVLGINQFCSLSVFQNLNFIKIGSMAWEITAYFFLIIITEQITSSSLHLYYFMFVIYLMYLDTLNGCKYLNTLNGCNYFMFVIYLMYLNTSNGCEYFASIISILFSVFYLESLKIIYLNFFLMLESCFFFI